MSENIEVHQKKHKGWWIPIELSRFGLLKIEQFLLAMIDSLDDEDTHCTASNPYLAEQMDLSVSSVSRYITKFKRMGLIEQVSFTGRKRTLRVKKENWYAKNPKISKKESYAPARRQTTHGCAPYNIANSSLCRERAINRSPKPPLPPPKQKPIKSPSSSPKKDNGKIAELVATAHSLGLALEERDFRIWLAKYPPERIERNLHLATRRKPGNLRRWLESAIRGDYAAEETNHQQNKAFFQKFAEENNLKFTLFKNHAMLDNGKELDFKLNPAQFNENLLNYFTKER